MNLVLDPIYLDLDRIIRFFYVYVCNIGLLCFVVGIKINKVFILCDTEIGANKMELWKMGIADKDWIRVNLHVEEKLIGHASYPEIKFVYNSPYLS